MSCLKRPASLFELLARLVSELPTTYSKPFLTLCYLLDIFLQPSSYFQLVTNFTWSTVHVKLVQHSQLVASRLWAGCSSKASQPFLTRSQPYLSPLLRPASQSQLPHLGIARYLKPWHWKCSHWWMWATVSALTQSKGNWLFRWLSIWVTDFFVESHAEPARKQFLRGLSLWGNESTWNI